MTNNKSLAKKTRKYALKWCIFFKYVFQYQMAELNNAKLQLLLHHINNYDLGENVTASSTSVSQSVQSVQLLSRVWLFATPWTAARQASLSHQQLLDSTQTHVQWVGVIPFSSCPQSLPATESFPMSQLFAWGVQSIGVSALVSVLPMNTQDWSSLGWTGWIFLQSKGLSRVFSNTTVQRHQFFGTQLSL